MKNFETIKLEKDERIAKIIMNRPEKLNAINEQMFDELKAALDDVNEDDNMRVMILTGAGKAFTASVDMKMGGGAKIGSRLNSDITIEEIRQFIRHRPQHITRTIVNMEKPTIAMVNGIALADGFDWAMACDIRIGSENARFMNAFTRMALFPNTGACWLHPKIMGLSKALELMYTGDWLDAEEAYRIGVLSRLVPADKLEEETMVLARRIAQGPPLSIKLMKLQTYRCLNCDLDTALELGADGEALMLTTQDHVEAVAAWLEKREPKFTGK